MNSLACYRPEHERGIVHTFGKSWGAPINECPRAETPIGMPCIDCALPFDETDRGVLTAFWNRDNRDDVALLDGSPYCAYHLRCFLTNTLGPELSTELLAKMDAEGR